MEKFKHLEPNFSNGFEGLFKYISKKYKDKRGFSSMNKTMRMSRGGYDPFKGK